MARLTDKELLNSPTTDDLIHVVDVSDTTANAAGTSKKVALGSLSSLLSGSSTFLDLTDTPAAYTGQAGKAVVVNLAEDALEFVAPTGTGTVTSVAVSGSDGIEVDSGSPITNAGTIALGVNKATMLTHLNVADGAEVNTVDSVNGATGVVVLDADDIDDSSTTNKFATAVELADITANTAARHAAVTVTDSAEIDFTLTGQNITASIVAGSIDETKLDISVNAKLDLADSATQPGDALTTLSGDLPFSQIEQIATNRILGRSTAGTGDIEALTGSQVRDIVGVDTDDSPQFAGVNVGHATDTTITRVSAGVIAVEGTTIARAGDNVSSFTNDAGYITADDQTAAQVPFTPAGNIAATDVQAALEELDSEKAATASPTLTGTTTVDRLDYDRAIGGVNAIGNLGATETIDWSTHTHHTGTLDSNITFTYSNQVSGETKTLYLSYDDAAQRTITWPTTTWLDNATGAAPTTPAASGNVLVVTLVYVGTTTYGSATGNYAVYT